MRQAFYILIAGNILEILELIIMLKAVSVNQKSQVEILQQIKCLNNFIQLSYNNNPTQKQRSSIFLFFIFSVLFCFFTFCFLFFSFFFFYLSFFFLSFFFIFLLFYLSFFFLSFFFIFLLFFFFFSFLLICYFILVFTFFVLFFMLSFLFFSFVCHTFMPSTKYPQEKPDD